MNPAVVARAVLTRLKADTALYSGGAWTSALAGGASYNKGNPTSLTFPFVAYSVEWNGDNCFEGLEGRCDITFTVYDEDARGTDRIEYLIDRIIGDATISSGTRTVPTFGLHNHALDLGATGTGNTLGANSERWTLERANISPSDTMNVNQATLVFTGRVGNTAVNQ